MPAMPPTLPQGGAAVAQMADTLAAQAAAEPAAASDAKTLPAPRKRHRDHLPSDRARSLLLLSLLGAALLVLWLRMLAAAPHWPLVLRPVDGGGIALTASSEPALKAVIGQQLIWLQWADGRRIQASAALLPRSPRWIVDDAKREHMLAMREQLAHAAQQGPMLMRFADGTAHELSPIPRGLRQLGMQCWGLSGLALVLYLAGLIVMVSRPSRASMMYGLMCLAVCLDLLLISTEGLPGIGLPEALIRGHLPLRLLTDCLTAGALLHLMLIYPRRHPGALSRLALGWAMAGSLFIWLWLAEPQGLWWWAQAMLIGYGLAATAVLRRRPGQMINPMARLLQRLVLAGTATLVLLTLAIAMAARDGESQFHLATIGSVVWLVFFASLLMLGPFLPRSQQVLREFMLLAGVATVAASLHLLLLALSPLMPMGSLLLALALSLLLYALARPWLRGQLAGQSTLSAERMFDRLYRVARALEQTPEQAGKLLISLLREIFDPLEASCVTRPVSRVRVVGNGASLVLPIPQLAGGEQGAILLRFARRGRRLFTEGDRELCAQLLEQLRRAVAYDVAVERGRSEERMRIAQDLHDDIGARLLTLMYKAPNPEIEEYIRHTLQDLKTLTRGLAASNHRLSHAAAEWKSDISQRLSITGCDLRWSFSTDDDLNLTMVQWSALTRVLRELVNNILTHAQASRVEIELHLEQGRLTLDVDDDGRGTAPQAWAHGLGLGGVRKRMKLMGGQVRWLQRDGGGIRCEVRAELRPEPANADR